MLARASATSTQAKKHALRLVRNGRKICFCCPRKLHSGISMNGKIFNEVSLEQTFFGSLAADRLISFIACEDQPCAWLRHVISMDIVFEETELEPQVWGIVVSGDGCNGRNVGVSWNSWLLNWCIKRLYMMAERSAENLSFNPRIISRQGDNSSAHLFV